MRFPFWTAPLRLGLGLSLLGLALAPAAGAAAVPAVVPSSAKALGLTLRPQAGLPAAVQRTRQAILTAAFRGEVGKLGRLALEGRPGFDCSFGPKMSPQAFWAQQEQHGGGVLARMVRVLRLPYAQQGRTFLWPAAARDHPTEADWAALLPVFGERQVRLWQGPDFSGYTGMRVGIAADGDWLFAIEGD